jgi:hypothetical protein
VPERIIDGALRAAAWMINKTATILAPNRELHIFTHRMHGADRQWSFGDAYRAGAGWAVIEFGGWVLEATWKTRSELKEQAAAAKRMKYRAMWDDLTTTGP